MLIGAGLGIIGAIIGMIVVANTQKKAKRFFEVIRTQGPSAARAELDRQFPAASQLTRKSSFLARQRFAGLALLGDGVTIEQELGALTGDPAGMAMAVGTALLALATISRDLPTLATRLESFSARVAVDKAVKPMRVVLQTMTTIALALARRTEPKVIRRDVRLSGIAQPLVETLLTKSLAMAFERCGNTSAADEWRQRLALLTGEKTVALAA